MVAFALQRQTWVIAAETVWPTKLKIFTSWDYLLSGCVLKTSANLCSRLKRTELVSFSFKILVASILSILFLLPLLTLVDSLVIRHLDWHSHVLIGTQQLIRAPSNLHKGCNDSAKNFFPKPFESKWPTWCPIIPSASGTTAMTYKQRPQHDHQTQEINIETLLPFSPQALCKFYQLYQ